MPRVGVTAFRLALLAATACAASAQAQQVGRVSRDPNRQLAPQLQPPGLNGQPGGIGGGGGGAGRGEGLFGFVDVRERVSLLLGQGGGGGQNVRLATVLNLGGGAAIERERVQGGLIGNLQYSLNHTGNAGRNRFTANGVGRIIAEPIRDTLTVHGQAFAGLINGRFGNAQLIDPIDQDNSDLNQFYSLATGANFSRDIADRIRATASYQFSYVNIGDRGGLRGGGGGGGGGFGGGGFGGLISNSTSQFANASIGLVPGTSRLTVTASGNYVENNQDLLEQRFRSYTGTFDLAYAVNRDFRLLGSVGYQDYESTRQSILFGPDFLAANGDLSIPTTPDGSAPDLFVRTLPNLPPDNVFLFGRYTAVGLLPPSPIDPLLFLPLPPGPNFLLNTIGRTQSTSNPFTVLVEDGRGGLTAVPTGFGPLIDPQTGSFIPDPSGARDTLFVQSGLVWNAGFSYSPSPRFFTDLRVGQRFQQVTVTGTLTYRLRRNSLITAQLTDGIETFGTIVTRITNGVPVSIALGNGRGGGGGGGRGGSFIGGCVLGSDPGAPFGCIDGEIQSISAGVFRSRIGSVSYSTGHPGSRLVVRATYNQRDYLDRGQSVGPGGLPIDPTLANRSDRSLQLDTVYSRGLGQNQALTAAIGGGYFDQRLAGRFQSYFVRANVRYNRSINERLLAIATLTAAQRFNAGDTPPPGSFFIGSGRDRTNLALTAGVRYQF